MATLVVRSCQKTNQLQSVQSYGKQRTHRNILESKKQKQTISARERALCQLTVCFEFQSRSDRRKGHKRCACKWYSDVNNKVTV